MLGGKPILFNLNARQTGYKDAALANFYAGLLDRFRAVPGVRSAALSQFTLVSGYWNDVRLNIPGVPAEEKRLSTCLMTVDSSSSPPCRSPCCWGAASSRATCSRPASPWLRAVCEAVLPDGSPVGQRIGFGDANDPADIEIVGVAKNSRYNDLRNENPPVAYVPFTQDVKNLGRVSFELRTAGDALALANTVRQIVHNVSAAVPVSEVTTQAAKIDEMTSQERTFADLCTCFALLALAIACVDSTAQWPTR